MLEAAPFNIPEYWATHQSRYQIMQFTGLLDKNGKEIYEGDIVKFVNPQKIRKKYRPQEVFWFEDKLTWRLRDIEGRISGIATENGLLHKVIGNIYENPELLQTR